MAGTLVLIADWDADSRTIYSNYLSHLGYVVQVAAGAEQAFHLACQYTPDVVITAWHLYLPDGRRLSAALKAHAVTEQIPVVVVTPDTSAGSQQVGEGIACDLLVVKPCAPRRLAESLRELLNPQISQN